MNTGKFLKESLIKLQKLGIDVLAQEKTIENGILSMPQEVLDAMEIENILGMILSSAGYILRQQGVSSMYVFDLEVPDISCMYTDFLESISRIAAGELVFTEIEEKTLQEDPESGQGIQTVRFRCNGMACEYKARLDYDWFDTGIFACLNGVLAEQNGNGRLYITGDGYQGCIVLYRTEAWAQRFYEMFGINLERP